MSPYEKFMVSSAQAAMQGLLAGPDPGSLGNVAHDAWAAATYLFDTMPKGLMEPLMKEDSAYRAARILEGDKTP